MLLLTAALADKIVVLTLLCDATRCIIIIIDIWSEIEALRYIVNMLPINTEDLCIINTSTLLSALFHNYIRIQII